MTYCPHDDDPQSCPPCRGAGAPRRLEPPVVGLPVFEARYPGRCVADCGDPIEEGDMIAHVGDDGYAHETCLLA